jgi:hypothetical protein
MADWLSAEFDTAGEFTPQPKALILHAPNLEGATSASDLTNSVGSLPWLIPVGKVVMAR